MATDIKRFKHGMGGAYLIRFEDGSMTVLKIVPYGEIENNLKIPAELRNRPLSLNEGEAPCMSLVCITNVWIDEGADIEEQLPEQLNNYKGKLIDVEIMADLKTDGKSFVTFQPFFEGTSNCVQLDEKQWPICAERSARAMILLNRFHDKYGIPISDLHRDNYRYDAERGILGFIDWESTGNYCSYEGIINPWILKSLGEDLKGITPESLFDFDLMFPLEFVKNLLKYGVAETFINSENICAGTIDRFLANILNMLVNKGENWSLKSAFTRIEKNTADANSLAAATEGMQRNLGGGIVAH